jgi:hypothetical protein
MWWAGGGAKGVKRVGVNECGGPGCDSKGRAHVDVEG